MSLNFIENFQANLFKPLILFFMLGFFVPILRVPFTFPDALYRALTTYLLLAIGWHGGIELVQLRSSELTHAFGFLVTGLGTNLLIGFLTYFFFTSLTKLRKIDSAAIAGYYGSDSAGTFVTAIGMLAAVNIAYDSYMPVMLAVMEIPGCFVALILISRLRRQDMDVHGNMPGEPGYDSLQIQKMSKGNLWNANVMREIFLNPGLYLLFGGIAIGMVAGLKGASPQEGDYLLFVKLFQPLLSLFLFSVGIMAAKHIKDLKGVGPYFYGIGIIAPNLFAILGILTSYIYVQISGHQLELGSVILFAVLCSSASYIALPAIQEMAFKEASPTLPLASSLGLTFTYNVTIGIPVYVMIATYVF